MKVFTDFSSTDLHDPETGRGVKFHTKGQRERFLARHPELASQLPPLADELGPPAFSTERDPPRVGVLARPVWPDRARRVTTPLLRDPITVAKPVTKPAPATTTTTTTTKTSPHSDERRWHVIFHEASHACIALMLQREVLGTSAMPNGKGSDGRVEYMQSGDKPGVNACISMAGMVFDELAGQYHPECYGTDEKHLLEDIGNNQELRAAIKAKTRDLLIEAYPAVMEIARQLFLKGELSAFETKAAYVRGMRLARAAGTATKAAPTSATASQSKSRTYDSSNPADAAEMERRWGKVIIGSAGFLEDVR